MGSKLDSGDEKVFLDYLKASLNVSLFFVERGLRWPAMDVIYDALHFVLRDKSSYGAVDNFIGQLNLGELPDFIKTAILTVTHEASGHLPARKVLADDVRERSAGATK